VRTNNFRDFECEGPGESEDDTGKVEYPGYAPQSCKIQTKLDVYLGEILLKRVTRK
jgi:hypothetical protein